MAKALPTYITRITWNDAIWRYPSKASGKAETGSYAAENGFGHEEWLNRSEWVINGWRYGFLQGVSSSRWRHSGEQFRILLYAVTPAKERRYVGELRRVELVDEKTVNAAAREMRRRGIARQMTRETGIRHVVDHIYPLSNPLVCGLHVAANLQVLTHEANTAKSNKMPALVGLI